MDQCNECTHKGNWEACTTASCSKHTSWYATQLKTRLAAAESANNQEKKQ